MCVLKSSLLNEYIQQRAPSSLNANENKEREIVGTLKQQGKNQQSETEKAKPYSAKRDFIRFSSPPLKYMVAINPPLNVLWAPLFMGSDNDSE